MNGKPFISAYTPSNTDPELLNRIIVQREKLLERIINRMTKSVTTGDKHHILLVVPRGSGKTHLVSLAAWDPRNDRPLFRLPLEIRRLVRPLLNQSLGPADP